MTIPKKYLTILTNVVLSFLGVSIAYFTDWYIVIPIIFGLGIPAINTRGAFRQKLGKTFVILLTSVALFTASIMSVIGVGLDKYLYSGFVVGVAGFAFLGINALLIETINLNLKSCLITFLLSGLSLPIWIYLTENTAIRNLPQNDFIRQFGAMILWMIAVTIGISAGIKTKKKYVEQNI